MRRTVKGPRAGVFGVLCISFLVFPITTWTSATEISSSEVPGRFCGLYASSKNGHQGAFNLSSLQMWSPWTYVFRDKEKGADGSKRLELNICGGAPSRTFSADDPCHDSTVCEIVGNKRNSFSTLTKSADEEINFIHGLMLYYRGPLCSSSKSHRLITILLTCGQHLGYPRLALHSECYTTFEWSTSGACTASPKREEVPCYAYDAVGQLYDLTSLIKTKGSYQVQTVKPDESFFINVCSEIVSDGTMPDSPKKISALYLKNKQAYGAGQLKSRLSFVNGNLQLTYEELSDEKIPGCSSPAKTVIVFRCPKERMIEAKPPLLVSSTDCYYEIIWETEHACPHSTLKGNSTSCSFTEANHGVDIDLSPLRTSHSNAYSILADINGTEYEFLLNVCGGVSETVKCGSSWTSNAVCMKPQNATGGTIIAKTSNSELKYVDGEVSLTYKGTKSCPRNKLLDTMVVINFICSENTVSNVTFLYEEECIYFFEWPTKYACPRKSNPSCSFSHASSQFNLAAISLATGQYVWSVVDSISGNGQSKEIYLNLCGTSDLLHGEKSCPDGALVCLEDKDNFVNLGSVMSEPKFIESTKAVQIFFTDGDACSRGRRKTTKLTITCSPGQVTKSPVLLHHLDCDAEIHWNSALGCPIHASTGTDCKVFDSDLGLVIDLSPLKSSSAYEIPAKDHSYFINVCTPVLVPGCPEDAGGCQKEKNEKSEKRAWSLGKAISNLTYRDSFVSLIYRGGTSYRDVNRTPRSMTIAFLCDPEAVNTLPVFAGEADRAYSFRWDTKYACPKEVSVDCMVNDPKTHQQYDLSSLTKTTDNWEVMDADGKRKFYLNVCRPINKVPLCKEQSAACIHTTDKGMAIPTNLGQALNAPEINSDGHLILHYTFGDACVAYGEKKNYSATINFICQKGSQSEGPRFLGALGSCQYSFLWSTQAACSVGDETERECNFLDPISRNKVDLRPLWRNDSFYEAESQGRKFRLNVCGEVGSAGCFQHTSDGESISACEVSPDGKSLNRTLGLADSQVIHTSANGAVRLTYIREVDKSDKPVPKGMHYFTHTEIRFECLYTENKLQFVNQENDTYFFVFGTPLVCIPDPVDCDVVDAHGLEYDLNALVSLGTSDWIVSDTTEQFHVSFCKSLTGFGGVACHGAGICKASGHNLYVSLGKQQRPRVISDGTVLIEYKDGSICPTRKTNYSAQISLHCSHNQGELRLPMVTLGCTYLFSLDTPAACPLKVFKGTNCQVTDSVYGHIFDLSPLRKRTSNYKVKYGEYLYLLNVCGSLNGSPSACQGSAICQTKETDKRFAVSTGKPSQNLTLRDGLIQLVYEDGKDKCHKEYTRKTVISFVCDHSTDGIEEGPSFTSEEHDCTYLFKWSTHYACPPFVVSNCNAEDSEGKFYDLSKLSLPHENYVVINPNNRKQKFLLNVCRSLVYQSDQLCHYESSACLINESDPLVVSKSVNMGNVMSSPEVVDGKLQLRYRMGNRCPMNNSTNLQTLIVFQCDPYAHRGQPEFVDYDSCVYNFIWRTASACAQDIKEKTAGHCTAVNPATGYVFDLANLTSKPGHQINNEGYIFLLNVCSKLQDSPCKGGPGVCLIKEGSEDKDRSLGKANGDLFYSQGSLFLNYTDGDACDGVSAQMSSLITFECSREDPGPVFVTQVDDCTFHFNWNTPLACEYSVENDNDQGSIQIPCVVHTENGTIDLTPLMQQENAFHTMDVTRHVGIYGINVCKSLSSFSDATLTHPGAVCSLCFGQTKPLSLGTLNKPPYMDSKKRLMLDYINGSVCTYNSKKKFSSRITFICDYSDENTLDIIDVDENECLVFFELNTPLACQAPQVQSFCNISGKSANYQMDLSALGNNGQPFQIRDGKDKYLVSVCHVVRTEGVCQGAGTCLIDSTGQEHNLGLIGKTSFFHNGVHLAMIYHTNERCQQQGSDTKYSEIKFYCSPAGLGKPQFYKRTDCHTIFLWATSAVCHLDHPPCTLYTKNKLFDLRELSSISHSWSARMNNESYWLNICQEVHPGIVSTFHNTTCPTFSSVCNVNQANKTTMLGNILTQRLAYNDKTKVLLLTYDHGDSICPPTAELAERKASAEIAFQCGTNVGSPTFISGPDQNCVYRFSWISSVACGETNNIQLHERNGILVDQRLESSDFILNITVIQNLTFMVKEPYRNDDNFSYAINLRGIGSTTDHLECTNAAVCQYKADGSFYRDIGTVGTSKYYLKGSGLRLVVTSQGRKCGKNKHKNATSIIMLQCSTADGLGTPIFQYENNNCDYIFHWDTIAVCPQSSKYGGYYGGVFVKHRTDGGKDDSGVLSVPSILGIVLLLLASVVLILVLARKERRNELKSKVKSCFRNINLPCYTYRDFQCYFLKNSGSLNSQTDGEAVLLAPDTFTKFQEDSDADPIA